MRRTLKKGVIAFIVILLMSAFAPMVEAQNSGARGHGGSSFSASTSKGMVIVTPVRFESELRPFVEHKRRELAVEVVTLERVLNETKGVDDPEKLKRFLYDAWKTRHARYVLLVGDASVLPVRYFAFDRIDSGGHDTAFGPCDMYYADVAKSNGSLDDWHARKDGHHALYFGEVHGHKNKNDPINFDQITYRPKLAVGRWPVNTPDQVRTLVSKTIAFETQLKDGNKIPPRVGLIAIENVGRWDPRDLMDRFAHSMPRNWNINKRYYSDERRKVSTPPPTEPEFIKLLNSGIDLMVPGGHGSSANWHKSLSIKGLGQIKNGTRLPVMISVGCTTAGLCATPPSGGYVDIRGIEHRGTRAGEAFLDYPTPPAPYQSGRFNQPSLGKELVSAGPNGAIAYIGCTGVTQMGWASTLAEGFVNAWVGGKGSRLGDCWVNAIDYCYDKKHLAKLKPDRGWTPPATFLGPMKYIVYGDPSLRLPR